jgi:pyridoxine 4-dehydrogenase
MSLRTIDSQFASGHSEDLTENDPNSGDADTTRLGNLRVPSIGIGTISWSSNNLLHLENIELQKLVTTAYESNAAFFDTAERYGSHYKTAMGMGWGETEKMTRMLLDRIPPKEKAERITPVIATKFTPSPWRTSVQSVVEACEQSRERLGVEQIDLYQLHMPDIVQPFRFFGKEDNKDAIYWDGLAECYHRGLVKNVGVCNYGPTLVTRCQEALAKRGVPLASNQIAFSLMGRHNGAQETLDKCNEMGVKVLAFFPFAMGLLTGKYSSNDLSKIPLKESPILSLAESKKTKLEEIDLKRYAEGDGINVPTGGIAPLLMAMEQISKVRNKSVAQVALNYIICKGAIPIPGARTNAQVFDNIGAMGWRLTNTEVALLEQTADSLGFGFEGAGFKRTSEKFVGYGVEKWRLD